MIGIPDDICGLCYHPKDSAKTYKRHDCESSASQDCSADAGLANAMRLTRMMLVWGRQREPIDKDVAEVFKSPTQVNKAIRANINAMPQKTSKRRSRKVLK